MTVEVIANYDKQDGLANGTDGIVRAVSKGTTGRWHNNRVGGISGRACRAAHPREACKPWLSLRDSSIETSWTPIFKRTKKFSFKLPANKGQEGEVKVHRCQFPLKLAIARTFHSAQGQSMDEACVDLSNIAGKAGMGYTAIGGVRTEEGLSFQKSASNAADQRLRGVTAFAGENIIAATKGIDEIERMRTLCQLKVFPAPLTDAPDAVFKDHNEQGEHPAVKCPACGCLPQRARQRCCGSARDTHV